jgi:hypothetical protein
MSMETDRLVLIASRLPDSVAVGDELYIRVKGRVRRIEADQIDVTAFEPDGARALLEGEVYVEFSILATQVDG